VVFLLWGRQQLIGLAPGLLLLPQQVSSYADAADAIAIAQVGVGIGQASLRLAAPRPLRALKLRRLRGTRSFPAVPYPEGVGPQLDQRCRTGLHLHHEGWYGSSAVEEVW